MDVWRYSIIGVTCRALIMLKSVAFGLCKEYGVVAEAINSAITWCDRFLRAILARTKTPDLLLL